MHGGELIDLALLIEVLEEYGARDADEGSKAKKALDQLKRGCEFRLGDKVLLRNGDEDANEWSRGVVVCYMLHQACFVIGAGDDREKRPKGAENLWGVDADNVIPRDAIPLDGKIVPWRKAKNGGAK